MSTSKYSCATCGHAEDDCRCEFRCPNFGDCPPRVSNVRRSVRCPACSANILAPAFRNERSRIVREELEKGK